MRGNRDVFLGVIFMVNSQSVLYRNVWRWHFYIGLLCFPVIIFMSISGGLYLFKPQIEAFRESSYNNISVDASRATPNQIIATAQSALPNARFHLYRLPKNDSDAVRISVLSEGVRYFVYVNPYDLSVIDVVRFDQLFTELLKDLHESIFMGSYGSYFVELCASWAIVLLVTGVILWWPRNSSGFAGVLYPRLQLRGRKLWKDLHVVIGIWISIFALFLLVTGLPWTQGWGSAFEKSRKWFEPELQQDWSTSADLEKLRWSSQAVRNAQLSESVYNTAVELQLAYPVTLSVSDTQNNVWKASSLSQNRPKRADAWIDGASGELIILQPFSERKIVDRIVGWGIAAHEGQLFGWFNQLLGVFTTVGLIFMSVSGFVLWWKRKPNHQLGAPKAMGTRITGVMLAVLMICAALLPAVLVTVVMLVVTDLLLKPIKPVRRWLGLS